MKTKTIQISKIINILSKYSQDIKCEFKNGFLYFTNITCLISEEDTRKLNNLEVYPFYNFKEEKNIIFNKYIPQFYIQLEENWRDIITDTPPSDTIILTTDGNNIYRTVFWEEYFAECEIDFTDAVEVNNTYWYPKGFYEITSKFTVVKQIFPIRWREVAL